MDTDRWKKRDGAISRMEHRNSNYYDDLLSSKAILANEYLEKHYPKNSPCLLNREGWKNEINNFGKKRNEITQLSIGGKNIIGTLDIRDWVNLEILWCHKNQLEQIIFPLFSKLKEVHCWENRLTELDLTNLSNLEKLNCRNNLLKLLILPTHNKKITSLDIRNNNFPTQTLANFSQLINLEELLIGCHDQDRIQKNLHNRFTGSLATLQNLDNLKVLDIRNTNINSGLEYLTNGLEVFFCSAQQIKNAQCQIISNLLADEEKNKLESTSNESIKNFSSKLYNYKKWRKLDFSEKEILLWISAKLTLEDYEIANNFKKEGYQKNLSLKEIIKKKSWQNIHPDFDYQLRKVWESKSFNEEKTQKWIVAGAKVNDHDFVVWLRDVKKLDPEWVTDYQDDYKNLSERFKKYGLCKECEQPHTGEQWCQDCNVKNSSKRILSLNQSGNSQIDSFVQKLQLQATETNKFLEWVPYEQFENIEYLAEGGFGKIYQARWKFGNIHHWDQTNNQWIREKDKDENNRNKNYREIVLKSLTNSQSNVDFLGEAAKHKLIDDWFNNIAPCYGLSQDPITGNYLMVMQYLPERDLRNYLKKTNREIKEKLALREEIEKKEPESSFGMNPDINIFFEKIKTKTGVLTEDDEKTTKKILYKNFSTSEREFLKELFLELESIKNGIIERINIKEIYEFYQAKLTALNLEVQKLQEKKQLDLKISDLQNRLSIKQKNNQLTNIARGLKDIHQKKLVHRDFHSGNILKGIEQTSCLITDLGLCRPVNELKQEEKIFGVMPYVAPEVLQGHPYTQASDIYSFGIVAYELLTGLPPYYDRKHDVQLGVEICRGLRPQSQIKIPALLEELINRCWANESSQRPTAHELEKILRNWQEEVDDYRKNSEFKKQLQETEEYNRHLPIEIRFPNYQIHYGAFYHSKLLPTQEITRVLQTSDLSICSTLVEQSTTILILPTKQITQLAQDPTKQEQFLSLEIKKMKKELDKSFTEEQKELLKKLLQNQKKLIENKEDEGLRKKTEELEEQLEENGFDDEEIKKISKYCKRFVKSEQELESEKLEAKIEIPTIKEI